MSRNIVITISIAVPEGASIAVSPAGPSSPAADDHLAEAPWPAAEQSSEGCPVHHVAWKLVPAGVSKTSGKAYDAFRACPERGCRERPA